MMDTQLLDHAAGGSLDLRRNVVLIGGTAELLCRLDLFAVGRGRVATRGHTP